MAVPFHLPFMQISGLHMSSRVTNRGKSRGREFWICASAAPCLLTAVGRCHIHSCGRSVAGQRTKSPCVPWDACRVQPLSYCRRDTSFVLSPYYIYVCVTHVPLVTQFQSEWLLPLGHKKAQDDVQFILFEASPNAFSEINSPLPRLDRISIVPCREWIYDKPRRFLTALSFG